MKRFLLVETGRPLAGLRRHGSFGHWISVAAGLSRRDVHTCAVAEGEPLPNASDYVGVLITGSGAMVSDREPWSEHCADWLRDAAEAGSSLFGICYGHQLIAHALGGEVGYNPRGRELGTVALTLHADAAGDPLFSGATDAMPVQTTHLQTVLRAPSEARVLARSALDDCQSFRWREHVWGVQFHPEFSVRTMCDYIVARADTLAKEDCCHRALCAQVRPTPRARQVLRRFVYLARKRSAGNHS